jgi:hypothetical protein
MRFINEVTVIIKKKSFPSFIDELYKRECDILELQHIEEAGEEGDLYTLRIAGDNLKRFEEFIGIIGAAGEKYKTISVKNVIEDQVLGGLIAVSGRAPLENITDYNTSVLGAADLIREKILKEDGARYTSISRNVGLVSGVKSGGESERVRLLARYADAERDAVVLNRFSGLNGYPLAVRFEYPEDVNTVLKKIESNFSALRITRIDEATVMIYDLIFSDAGVPVLSVEHDEVPLYILTLLVKIMMKYRLKAEETTVGFIGIDLSVVRLTRVLDRIGFRRILGFDHGEKAMLTMENQGGLATTAENIFSNADITILMKNDFDHEEYLKIRPGQLVLSFMEDQDQDMDVISGKGVRELIRRNAAHLSAVSPGLVRGVIDARIRNITDAKLVEYAKKMVGFLSDTYEFPSLFSDIHDRVYKVILSGAGK